MPTLQTLQTALAQRLNDDGTFYPTAELTFALNEGLKFWNLLTGDNRVFYALQLDPDEVWYDLQTIPDSPRLTSVTISDLILSVQILLMENIHVTSQFNAGEMFTAVQTKRDEFLLRTQYTRTVREIAVAPQVAIVPLPSTVIDTPRAYWLPDAEDGIPSQLDKSDEFTTLAYDTYAPLTPGDPISYIAGMGSPYTVQLVPPPENAGTVEFITVETNNDFTLNIPNDLSSAILWGAVSYLLSMSMEAEDKQRAEYAGKRFDQYVEMASQIPTVLSVRIAGVPMFTDAVETLDSFAGDWRTSATVPSVVGTAGGNLLAIPSDTAQTITVQMVGNATLLSAPTDVLALGAEVVDAILDYAQHLLSFKMGGADFTNTLSLMRPIVTLAAKRNQIVAGLSVYSETIKGLTNRADDFELPKGDS